MRLARSVFICMNAISRAVTMDTDTTYVISEIFGQAFSFLKNYKLTSLHKRHSLQ